MLLSTERAENAADECFAIRLHGQAIDGVVGSNTEGGVEQATWIEPTQAEVELVI